MKKSFTLIETIVVIATIGLTLPVLFTLFFTLLREQVKIYHYTEVKRQGDYIVSVMENTIRNNAYIIWYDFSGAIYNPCAADGATYNITNNSPPYGLGNFFIDKYGNRFNYNWNGTTKALEQNYSTIASVPAPTIPVTTGNLTSSKVNITFFEMKCTQASQYSAPLIRLVFTIAYNTTSTRPEETVSLSYQTYIKLRNFPTQ